MRKLCKVITVVCAVFCWLYLLPSLGWAAVPKAQLTNVRIGYLEDPGYMEKAQDGTYYGYDVEFLINIAQYAGLRLEYVDYDSIASAYAAMDKGEIDMLLGFVKTPEREQKYLFSRREIGSISGTIEVLANEHLIDYGNISALSKMRFAVESDNYIEGLFKAWAKDNGFTPQLQVYANSPAALQAVENGEADAFISSGAPKPGYHVVMDFSAMPFYIMFGPERNFLKQKIDTAMSAILANDPLYEIRLANKYAGGTGSTALVLSQAERQYMWEHPVTRVAVLSNDAPYFYVDDQGKQKGILVDYFTRLGVLTGLQFEFQEVGDQAQAIQALQEGKADVIGLYSSTLVSAYNSNLALTVPYATVGTVMMTHAGISRDAVHSIAVKKRSQQAISKALKQAERYNYVMCDNAQGCFAALEKDAVDAVICGLPSATWLVNQANTPAYNMSELSGIKLDLCAAVPFGNEILRSILEKSIRVSSYTVDGIVANNTLPQNTWRSFIVKLPPTLIVAVTVTLLTLSLGLLIAIFLLQKRQAEKNALLAAQAVAEKQQLAAAALEKTAEERNRFFAAISHDMRTPLNAIIGFAGLMAKDVLPAKDTDYVSKIVLSGQLLLELINDTLMLSKMNSGKLELKLAPVDTKQLAEMVTVPIQAAAETKGVHFIFEQSYRRRNILIDKVNVQKIFLNLLSNAVKFTPPGKRVWFIVKDEPADSPDPANVIIVKDEGIGMSREYQKRLYEPFSQERRAGYEALGTGLGLSIVKRLVELMGGTIEAVSEENKGTQFTVRLHFAEAAAGQTQAQQQEQPVYTESSLAGKKILLCEDNALNREIAGALLRDKKLQLIYAENGQKGLEAFAASKIGEYAAILMDVRMPVMDGYAATRAIRALDRSDAKMVPIIAMTADAAEEDVQKCYEAGMNGYVSKPINPRLLFEELAKNLH